MPVRARRRPLLAGAAAIAAATGLLTGCGGGGGSNGEVNKPASQILTDAEKATAGASAVRFQSKPTSTKATYTVDVVAGQGQGGGTVMVQGNQLNIVLHDGTFYLKTTAPVISTFTGNPGLAQQDANQWLRTTATNQAVAQEVGLLDITKLANGFTFNSNPTKGKVTNFGGQKAIPLTDSSDDNILYVAATGKPYVLGEKGANGAVLVYSDYNSAKIPAAPPNAKLLKPAS